MDSVEERAHSLSFFIYIVLVENESIPFGVVSIAVMALYLVGG